MAQALNPGSDCVLPRGLETKLAVDAQRAVVAKLSREVSMCDALRKKKEQQQPKKQAD